MKRTIDTEKVPIKLWLDYLEDGAKQQAKNLANLPFTFKHVAIMPDSHEGYGMPIGGVLATTNAVIPNAVGVDIGCGVCAVKTSLTGIDKDTLKKIIGGSKSYHGGIRAKIPVGFKHHNKAQDRCLMPAIYGHYEVVPREYSSALKQLGTLGGGNHFIEIQKGSDGYIWLMIHSGSRNVGHKVATHYNELAKTLSKKYNHNIPPSWDLAYLPYDSEEGLNYLEEMSFCVEFALANRKLMMTRVQESIVEVVGDVVFEEMINIAHNYAAVEKHFGENVIVHRKGATSAFKNQLGIIPGSQGSFSYIVKGKGNPESFMSCSHGAGRKLSRKKAKIKLSLSSQIAMLNNLGVIHSVSSVSDLDEAPGAYKDIIEVMANQMDLVDIEVSLRPLAVIKG